jgi:hypothetical protein
MGLDSLLASGAARIVAGVGVFIVASIIQASMGDSSMFSMEYRPGNLFQDLMVNVTFWPGWLLTIGLIGSGVMELLDSGMTEEDPGEGGSNASPARPAQTWSVSDRPQPAWSYEESPPSVTHVDQNAVTAAEREGPAAGWYADPAGSDALRYWDGEQWGSELRAAPGQPFDNRSPGGNVADA